MFVSLRLYSLKSCPLGTLLQKMTWLCIMSVLSYGPVCVWANIDAYSSAEFVVFIM
jgi:hypothetical protein